MLEITCADHIRSQLARILASGIRARARTRIFHVIFRTAVVNVCVRARGHQSGTNQPECLRALSKFISVRFSCRDGKRISIGPDDEKRGWLPHRCAGRVTVSREESLKNFTGRQERLAFWGG